MNVPLQGVPSTREENEKTTARITAKDSLDSGGEERTPDSLLDTDTPVL
jgi:hypothetical protein